MDKSNDSEPIYCRKLGHHLTFNYCRNEHHQLPCPKIRDCWYKTIDIDRFVTQNYPTRETNYLFQPAEPKINTLIELIQRAQQNAEQK